RSDRIKNYDEYTEQTFIEIEADIVNKGLEPTSISKILLNLDYKGIKDVEVYNSSFGKESSFKKIRVDSNDRLSQRLSTLIYGLYLPNEIKEINATLIFHTTHKDLKKGIKLIKTEII
ncbi:MAG: hypothetical protein V1663_02435, partial [archaeon]